MPKELDFMHIIIPVVPMFAALVAQNLPPVDSVRCTFGENNSSRAQSDLT